MDSDTFSSVIGGAVFVGILLSIYYAYRCRRRSAERLLIRELLKQSRKAVCFLINSRSAQGKSPVTF